MRAACAVRYVTVLLLPVRSLTTDADTLAWSWGCVTLTHVVDGDRPRDGRLGPSPSVRNRGERATALIEDIWCG